MIMKRSNYIFLIVGPSGSGKSTVVQHLCDEYGLKQIESYTTRPPRYVGEKGHTFVTDEEFAKLTGMVGYTEFDGHRYCSLQEDVEKSDLYVIDPAGIEYFREHYTGSKRVIVIGIWATEAVRKKRMFLRGDSEDGIQRRLEADRAIFNTDVCDVVFYNKILQETIGCVSDYIFRHLFCTSKLNIR